MGKLRHGGWCFHLGGVPGSPCPRLQVPRASKGAEHVPQDGPPPDAPRASGPRRPWMCALASTSAGGLSRPEAPWAWGWGCLAWQVCGGRWRGELGGRGGERPLEGRDGERGDGSRNSGLRCGCALGLCPEPLAEGGSLTLPPQRPSVVCRPGPLWALEVVTVQLAGVGSLVSGPPSQ